MKKKCLLDYHHGDLYESLRILLEERLGWEIYRPVGLEWFYEGYWAIWDDVRTADQFLGLHQIEPVTVHNEPVTQMFGEAAWMNRFSQEVRPGEHLLRILFRGQNRWHKGVRLETAKKMDFDIVLSSMHQHYATYEKFRKRFCPKAKHIYQIGNHIPLPKGVQNVLNSTTVDGRGVPNHVRYHQEFSLEDFKSVPCENPKSMTNFLHFQMQHYLQDFEVARAALEPLGWTIKDFGAGNPNGPTDRIHEEMKKSGIIWHCKKDGDGYGYNIHNSFACGRPIVIRGNDYKGQMAEALFVDGETIINIDKHPMGEAIEMIKAAADDHETWRNRVTNKFKEVVDFDRELVEVKAFLDQLL